MNLFTVFRGCSLGRRPCRGVGSTATAVDREKRDMQLLKLLTHCCGAGTGGYSASSHVCCYAFRMLQLKGSHSERSPSCETISQQRVNILICFKGSIQALQRAWSKVVIVAAFLKLLIVVNVAEDRTLLPSVGRS